MHGDNTIGVGHTVTGAFISVGEGLTSVRVTLQDSSGEYTVYQNDYPANASRHPEIELATDNPGTYTYRVYINDAFKYSDTVTFE